MSKLNKWMTWGVSAVFAAAVPLVGLAADDAVSQEVSMAEAHAKMAASADSLEMTHTHLHHVINCLVGEDGEGFDANEANPCHGMGDGALPDSADNTDVHAQLQTAASDARAALNDDDKASAQETAHQIAQALGQEAASIAD